MWDNDEEMIAELTEAGCIQGVSYDEDGDPMVRFNMPVLEVKYPDVYAAIQEVHNEEVDEALSSLVDQGLIQMSFQEGEDGTLEAVYSLTDLGKQVVESQEFLDSVEF